MAPDFDSENSATARPALTVSALTRAVAGLLERSFPLVRVRGELANLMRASSGHWYFALKDDDSQVRCVMFRSRNQLIDWVPRDGDDVEIDAIVSLYAARGEFQLNVEFVRRAGQGRLFEEFLRLKDRLAAEGLFAAARKRTLPKIPRRVAVVTSMQAAALTDVVTTLCRRAPYVGVLIFPVPVQGTGAGSQIARMLQRIGRRATADAIDLVLLVRGGGSIEDLWAFNEEVVARAIVACPVPVVVGVGHESDSTIADFAADLRAPTPTAAAELVAPAGADLADECERYLRRIWRQTTHRMQGAAQRLDYAQRALAAPRMPIMALEHRLGSLRSHMTTAAARHLEGRRAAFAARRERLLRLRPRHASDIAERLTVLRSQAARHWSARSTQLAALAARLHAIDPHAVLARGYAIAVDAKGRTVTDAAALVEGQLLKLRFARGQAGARVQSVLRETEPDGER